MKYGKACNGPEVFYNGDSVFNQYDHGQLITSKVKKVRQNFYFILFYENNELRKKETYNKNNELVHKSQYLHNQLHGIQKSFKNGALKSQSTYTNGTLHGYSYFYYPNGQLQTKTFYLNGKPDSLWYRFSIHGDTLEKIRYEKGKLIDFLLCRDENNNDLHIGSFQNGEGELITYTLVENKAFVQRKCSYSNGVPNGQEIVYFIDTQKPLSVKNFEAGVLHGSFIRYHKNGEVQQTGHYNYGNLDGEISYYNSEGKLIYVELYDNGEMKLSNDLRERQIDGELNLERIAVIDSFILGLKSTNNEQYLQSLYCKFSSGSLTWLDPTGSFRYYDAINALRDTLLASDKYEIYPYMSAKGKFEKLAGLRVFKNYLSPCPACFFPEDVYVVVFYRNSKTIDFFYLWMEVGTRKIRSPDATINALYNIHYFN
jgi:antitoxin component YwqK of YwqJK toxin-antitoxin module